MAEITLAALRVVQEVARSGSFSGAAESLGYTQSAVSRQVAAAERFVGTPLFDRHARGVRPTPAGEILIRHAGRALGEVAAATQELAGMRDRLAGRLVVGGFPTALAVLLPRAIATLRGAHPALDVRVSEGSTPAQLAALRRGRLEVAVVASGRGLPDYDLGGLGVTELGGSVGAGVAVADSHVFAAREWLAPSDLEDQAWVVGVRSGAGPEFGAWPTIAEPAIAFAVRDWAARLGFVAAGLGIAVVPGLAAEAMPRGVRWIPVRGDDDPGGLGRACRVVTAADPSAPADAMVRALADAAAAPGRSS